MNFNETPSTISFRGYGNRKLMDVQNARIMFKNFAGNESEYNRKGDANFALVVANPEVAEQLANEGWNVKIWTPKNGGDPIQYVRVNSTFNEYGPRIFIIDNNGMIPSTPISAEEAGLLDRADIAYIDLTISPYHWERNIRGEHSEGISAYLKEMYVTLNRSPFESRYMASPREESELPF